MDVRLLLLCLIPALGAPGCHASMATVLRQDCEAGDAWACTELADIERARESGYVGAPESEPPAELDPRARRAATLGLGLGVDPDPVRARLFLIEGRNPPTEGCARFLAGAEGTSEAACALEAARRFRSPLDAVATLERDVAVEAAPAVAARGRTQLVAGDAEGARGSVVWLAAIQLHAPDDGVAASLRELAVELAPRMVDASIASARTVPAAAALRFVERALPPGDPAVAVLTAQRARLAQAHRTLAADAAPARARWHERLAVWLEAPPGAPMGEYASAPTRPWPVPSVRYRVVATGECPEIGAALDRQLSDVGDQEVLVEIAIAACGSSEERSSYPGEYTVDRVVRAGTSDATVTTTRPGGRVQTSSWGCGVNNAQACYGTSTTTSQETIRGTPAEVVQQTRTRTIQHRRVRAWLRGQARVAGGSPVAVDEQTSFEEEQWEVPERRPFSDRTALGALDGHRQAFLRRVLSAAVAVPGVLAGREQTALGDRARAGDEDAALEARLFQPPENRYLLMGGFERYGLRAEHASNLEEGLGFSDDGYLLAP